MLVLKRGLAAPWGGGGWTDVEGEKPPWGVLCKRAPIHVQENVKRSAPLFCRTAWGERGLVPFLHAVVRGNNTSPTA